MFGSILSKYQIDPRTLPSAAEQAAENLDAAENAAQMRARLAAKKHAQKEASAPAPAGGVSVQEPQLEGSAAFAGLVDLAVAAVGCCNRRGFHYEDQLSMA